MQLSRYVHSSPTAHLLTLPHPQTYVRLSSMKEWATTDGAFNLIHFYHLIMRTLSDKTNQWVIETMNWWKK